MKLKKLNDNHDRNNRGNFFASNSAQIHVITFPRTMKCIEARYESCGIEGHKELLGFGKAMQFFNFLKYINLCQKVNKPYEPNDLRCLAYINILGALHQE